MADAPLTPEEWDALAADLALNLLEGAERDRALGLRQDDPAFAAAVTAWEERLAPLFDEIAPVDPPATIWLAIAERLSQEKVVDLRMVRQLRMWRRAAIAASAIAAALAMVLVLSPADLPVVAPASSGPIMVAQLASTTGGPSMAASFDPASSVLRIKSAGIAPGRLTPELWIIPADGRPRSLGLIAHLGTTGVVVPAALRPHMREGGTLAVTMEEAGTAPHAAPSAAPVAAGTLAST